MSSSPVKIAIPAAFVEQFQPRLQIPHTLVPLNGQSDAEMKAILEDSDVLVSGGYKPEWKLAETRRPLLVHSSGAGVDGISIPSLPRRSTVCNVYGHERAVAERAFMHMLALNQNLLALDRSLRKGDWTHEKLYLPELRNKNLLILGLGHIGRELIRWGKFLEMNVTALTRNMTPERALKAGVTSFGSLRDLHAHLPRADFVVIAIPSAEGTTDLFGQAEFAMMKRSAFIINVGRGPVLNEVALFEALKSKTIAGAGLDVWYQYPALGQRKLPSTQPFQELDNVIMTPHKATIETMEYRWREIAANIANYMSGAPLKNVVWKHSDMS
jgi:phosphoglycerate dehydrogenase-like enzyme